MGCPIRGTVKFILHSVCRNDDVHQRCINERHSAFSSGYKLLGILWANKQAKPTSIENYMEYFVLICVL